ncbi:MAG TPA: glycosyltransferase family 4 protein [Bryobacteraceae bacterium]|nr:glycosyltransferase family 4 protein [Bryobacteraceae bacterium]
MPRHIITSEYPPQSGGVSDYTQLVADGLAQEGKEVHVWCPGGAGESISAGGVHVHSGLGRVTPEDLARVGEQLDRFPGPRQILVQYVPHGYGYKSMNVPFCLWLWRRARKHGDYIEVMVHEAFHRFAGSWRQYGAALVHRLMTVILLRAATRVWFSDPQWERRWKPYAMGRNIPFQWLPVPSNIRVVRDEAETQAVRRRYLPQGGLLIGHFGTYGAPVLSVLEPIALAIARELPGQPLLLMGINSQEFRKHLIEQHPPFEKTLFATGPLVPVELSSHITACDVLIQPYPDGATTRRTSLMVALSHGKAVLTTSNEETEGVWKDFVPVGLTPCGDASAFVQLLRELLDDPQERARMSQAAGKLYRERFDISHTIAALRTPASEIAASESIVCAS